MGGRQGAADREAEVLVAGGGMVGLAFATALAEAGVAVVVVDRLDPAQQRDEASDGRSSAIARGTQQMLAVLGLWDGMAEAASPIIDIRISDGRPYPSGLGPPRPGGSSALHLHFASQDVADDGDTKPLGYIVE